MPAMTIVIAAAIIGLILGSALVPGAPIFALPIVAILIVVLGVAELRRRSADARSMESFRDEADSEPIEFTARDKQTLVD
jgi:type III secretory pathway component EscV